MFMPLK